MKLKRWNVESFAFPATYGDIAKRFKDVDVVIHRAASRGKTLEFLRTLKEVGVAAINDFDSVSQYMDKWVTSMKIEAMRPRTFLPLPTVLSLYTRVEDESGGVGFSRMKLREAKAVAEDLFGYPMIKKPLSGSHGEGLTLINDADEFYRHTLYSKSIFLLQPYIQSFFDLRLDGSKASGEEPKYVAGISRLSRALVKNTHAKINPGIATHLKLNERLERMVRETMDILLPDEEDCGTFGLDYICPVTTQTYDEIFDELYEPLRGEFAAFTKARKSPEYSRAKSWLDLEPIIDAYQNTEVYNQAVRLIDDVINDPSTKFYFLEANVVQEFPHVELLNRADIGIDHVNLALSVIDYSS